MKRQIPNQTPNYNPNLYGYYYNQPGQHTYQQVPYPTNQIPGGAYQLYGTPQYPNQSMQYAPYPGAPQQYQQPQYYAAPPPPPQYPQAYPMAAASNPMMNCVPNSSSQGCVPQPAVSPVAQYAAGVRSSMPLPEISRNFIPPMTNSPQTPYIAPNPELLPNKQKYYANLYSILASINALIELSVSVGFDQDEVTKKLQPQFERLQTVMYACDYKTIEKIRKFAKMTNLDISYADQKIVQYLSKQSQPRYERIDAAQVGASLVEFNNYLYMTQTPDDYQKFRIALYTMLFNLIPSLRGLFPQLTEQAKSLEAMARKMSDLCVLSQQQLDQLKAKIKGDLSAFFPNN